MAIFKNKDVQANINNKGVDLGNIGVNFYTEDDNTSSIRIYIKWNGQPVDLNTIDMKPRLDLFLEDKSIFLNEPVDVVLPESGLIQYIIPTKIIKHIGKVDAKLFLESEERSVHVANFNFNISDSGVEKAVAKEISVNIVDNAVRKIVKENAIEILGDGFEERLNTDVVNHLDSNPELFKGEKGDTGEQGIQGERGLKGDTGERGPQGLQGPRGFNGQDGLNGARGEKGEKGEKGESFKYNDFTQEDKYELAKISHYPEISIKGAIAYKKMNTSPSEWLGNNIKICVWANSLGAGNGASSSNLSWPSRLKSNLNYYSRVGQTVDIINRSIGGYYASQVNDEFPEPSGADISIISFGTNEFNKVQRTELYYEALEKIIKKEISGGSTIVLTTMPQWGSKDWQVKASNGSMEDYNQIVHDIGNKYNIPVLDLFKETRNLDWSAFKTGEAVPHIHFNDIGYQMIAQKVAAFIGFQTPGTLRGLENGNYLGVRAGIDGIKYVGDYYYLSEDSKYPTPAETTEGKGIAISANETEKVFHYAVKVAEDNLLLYPNFNFTSKDGTEQVRIEINGRNNPFLYSNNSLMNENTRNRIKDTLTLSSKDFNVNSNYTQNIYNNSNDNLYSIPFAVKGHYIITVKIKNTDFFGFDCVASNVSKLINSKKDTGWIPLTLKQGSNTDGDTKPSCYRKIIDGNETRILLNIAIKDIDGNVFATLPDGFHAKQLTRLPAFSGTTPQALVIGGTGNLVFTNLGANDNRCKAEFVL